jgi:hypothetical protein
MSASPGGSEARPAVSVWHSPGLNTAINLSWPASLSDRDLSRLALPRRGQVPLALGSVHSPLWLAGSESMRGCGIQWARTRYKANSSGCDADATTRLHRAAAKRCASVRICCSHQPSSRLSRASFSGPNRRRQERHGLQKLTGPDPCASIPTRNRTTAMVSSTIRLADSPSVETFSQSCHHPARSSFP